MVVFMGRLRRLVTMVYLFSNNSSIYFMANMKREYFSWHYHFTIVFLILLYIFLDLLFLFYFKPPNYRAMTF